MASLAQDRWSRALGLGAVLVAGVVAIGSVRAMKALHGESTRALAESAGGPLLLGLTLCLCHRMINGLGWTLVLRALGQPMKGVAGIRIWILSEGFRWLPGSVWGFGSRTALATRQGVPAATAAASVLVELLLTLGAWMAVALSGWGAFRDPARHLVIGISPRMMGVGLGLAAAALLMWAWARRSPRVASRLGVLGDQFREFRGLRPSRRGLAISFVYIALMNLFNGLAFAVVLQAIPEGWRCPVATVVAANAIAWIVGFLAIMAPGGLVVREACLTALLTPWIPLEQAALAAVTWRSLQVVAEVLCVVCFGAWFALATWGRPKRVWEREVTRSAYATEYRSRSSALNPFPAREEESGR